MDIAYANRVSPAFLALVIALCARLGIKPSWLMVVFHKESGINPRAVNRYSGASGLIQFMPGTARNLGTTVEAIRRMSGAEQLTYVEAYFQPYVGRMHSLWDCYFAVFYPKAIGKPTDFVLFSKGSLAYKWNKALDMNHNGHVTVGDVKLWLSAYLPDDFDPCECDCN
jgi:hypothetical protein